MTKRETLLSNCITLLQKEVCSPDLSSHRIPFYFATIKKLQGRLKLKTEKSTETDLGLFGRQTVYPDGTKHYVSNSWYA